MPYTQIGGEMNKTRVSDEWLRNGGFYPVIDKESWFYKNCKKQRKRGAKICQECPFRGYIEETERDEKVGHEVTFDGHGKYGLDVLYETIAQLEDEKEALRKLAHGYIQAYEKLAFGDALLTAPAQNT